MTSLSLRYISYMRLRTRGRTYHLNICMEIFDIIVNTRWVFPQYIVLSLPIWLFPMHYDSDDVKVKSGTFFKPGIPLDMLSC